MKVISWLSFSLHALFLRMEVLLETFQALAMGCIWYMITLLYGVRHKYGVGALEFGLAAGVMEAGNSIIRVCLWYSIPVIIDMMDNSFILIWMTTILLMLFFYYAMIETYLFRILYIIGYIAIRTGIFIPLTVIMIALCSSIFRINIHNIFYVFMVCCNNITSVFNTNQEDNINTALTVFWEICKKIVTLISHNSFLQTTLVVCSMLVITAILLRIILGPLFEKSLKLIKQTNIVITDAQVSLDKATECTRNIRYIMERSENASLFNMIMAGLFARNG